MIALWLALFGGGLFVLIKSADYLVEGASSLALKFNMSPIVIGLTVVAFGTSAPELVVSLTSALQNSTEIALGNITGSNIANILLILGVSAIIYPISVLKNTVWKEIPMSFLAAIILSILGLQNWFDNREPSIVSLSSPEVVGSITFSNGLVLLAFFIIFIYYTFGISKTTGESTLKVVPRSISKISLFIAGGLIGLTLGSKIVVGNAIMIARFFSVSDTLIGLTLVAVGTSLPELVTSITAARKRNSDIVIGNIIGSNIFNIFLILGITSLVHSIPLTGQGVMDIIVLLAVTLILFVSLFVAGKHKISKTEGWVFLLLYAFYLVFIVVREF